jgi:hypothetical protein
MVHGQGGVNLKSQAICGKELKCGNSEPIFKPAKLTVVARGLVSMEDLSEIKDFHHP